LTLLVGRQEGHPARKKYGGWWRWALVSPDGVAPSRMVSVSASVDLPLHHKVQKFSSGTGLPGWSRKRAVKWSWSWMPFLLPSQQCQLKALKETKHWPQPVVWPHVFRPSATNCQLQVLCIIVLYHYYYLCHGGI